VRLALLHPVRGHEHFRNREACRLETRDRHRASARRDHCPASAIEPCEELRGSRDRRDASGVLRLQSHELRELGVGVEPWSDDADRIDGTPSVYDGQEVFRREPVPASPVGPVSLDVGGGVHENSVEVEEHGAALHDMR